jgi:hypothetical protein
MQLVLCKSPMSLTKDLMLATKELRMHGLAKGLNIILFSYNSSLFSMDLRMWSL